MSSIEKTQSEWDEKFDKLEKDFDNFRLYFDKHRTCKCKDVDDCRHFDKAIQIFDKQLSELDQINLKLFGLTYQKVWNPILERNNNDSC